MGFNGDLQQHFLSVSDDVLKSKVLGRLYGLDFFDVVEFGAGKGDFTKIFQECGHRIHAYEIDSSLESEFLENTFNAEFIVKDIREIPQVGESDVVVAAPPYDLLLLIYDRFIRGRGVRYILMVPPKLLGMFPGCEVLHVLSGEDFSPPSRGEHYVITNIPNV